MLTRPFALQCATSLQTFLAQNERYVASAAKLQWLANEEQTSKAELKTTLAEMTQQATNLRYMHAAMRDAPGPNFIWKPLVDCFNDWVDTDEQVKEEQEILSGLQTRLVSFGKNVTPAQWSRLGRRKARAQHTRKSELDEEMASLEHRIIEKTKVVNTCKDIANSELRQISRHHARRAVRRAELYNPVDDTGNVKTHGPRHPLLPDSGNSFERVTKTPPPLDAALETKWKQVQKTLETTTNAYNQLLDSDRFASMCEAVRQQGRVSSDEDVTPYVLNIRHKIYKSLCEVEHHFVEVRARAMAAGAERNLFYSHLGEFNVYADDDEDTPEEKPWMGVDEDLIGNRITYIDFWCSRVPSSATSGLSNNSGEKSLNVGGVTVGEETSLAAERVPITKYEAQRRSTREHAEAERRQYLKLDS